MGCGGMTCPALCPLLLSVHLIIDMRATQLLFLLFLLLIVSLLNALVSVVVVFFQDVFLGCLADMVKPPPHLHPPPPLLL